MWLVYAFIGIGLQGFVGYIDEYLTIHNKSSESKDVQTQIGGLVLISTIMSLLGAMVVSRLPGAFALPLQE